MSVLPVPTAPGSSAFLPLTFAAITAAPARGAGLSTLVDRAQLAASDAEESWLALLGDCAGPARGRFPRRLRLLSEAVDEYAGGTRRVGGGPPERVAAFERWIGEALAEGDGADFAVACAGYDAALAGALICARTDHRVAG